MNPLHWSQLSKLRESPAHYRYYLDNPQRPTTAMTFSTLVHAALFGPGPYGLPVVFDGSRRGNAWKAFKEDNVGSEIVTSDEVDRASDVAAAVSSDPVAGPLVEKGVAERTIQWKVGDRECEGTPDNVLAGATIDLKVSPVNSPARFPAHAARMGWHGQQAWYANGLKASGWVEVPECKIIAVAPKPPYCPVVYDLTPDDLEMGAKLWRSLFEQLLVCEASDVWPGYVQTEIPLNIPDGDFEIVMGGETIEM